MARADTLTREQAHELSPDALRRRYFEVRAFTEALCEPLHPEDCVIQSMPDVSPTRWHLAHTTWFFETFVLGEAVEGYQPVHPAFGYLFNSYYNAIGKQFSRSQRGLLSRPTVDEILAYRRTVDSEIDELLSEAGADLSARLLAAIEIGLHHEQQHQELILTDIKHVLSSNPLFPAYREANVKPGTPPQPLDWLTFEEGLHPIGHAGGGFAYDNELPRHGTFVEAFQLATRLVTNREYEAFLNDGGYRRSEFWLSAGWDRVCAGNWKSPLYWIQRDGGWSHFTLAGLEPIDPGAPVCHVSYFEADAYARWAGARLPTEAEWEIAAADRTIEGNFVESGLLQPVAPGVMGDSSAFGARDAGKGGRAAQTSALSQLFGDVWEWTASPYVGYPGYAPTPGALGEYNGKFMCNQYVLRGGSCATSRSHIRHTYRNFFPPEARWQFSGIRLARDGSGNS